jgi:hypothetical protein
MANIDFVKSFVIDDFSFRAVTYYGVISWIPISVAFSRNNSKRSFILWGNGQVQMVFWFWLFFEENFHGAFAMTKVISVSNR